jgi:hypothetical protein
MLGTSPETEDSPRVSSSTTQIKSNIQQYEYMGLVGLIVLAIVVYIFRWSEYQSTNYERMNSSLMMYIGYQKILVLIK